MGARDLMFFDPEIVPVAWFDAEALSIGWFDKDIVQSTGGAVNMSISESVSASDSYSPVYTLAMMISESVSATESVSSVASFSMAISELVSAVDGVMGGAAFSASVTEVVTAGDGVLVGLLFTAAVSESVAASDIVSLLVTRPSPVIKGWVAQTGKAGIWVPVGLTTANWSAEPDNDANWINS